VTDGSDIVDLGFSRWRSDAFFLGVAAVASVLCGAALVTWAAIDALASRQMDSYTRTAVIITGLIWAGSMVWILPHSRAFIRSRLLVGAAGVQLDARGRRTYRWAEVERFAAKEPFDVMGLTSAGAEMHLRDGQVIPLVLLDHFGGGPASLRAIAEITNRVGMMNRLLAEATAGAAGNGALSTRPEEPSREDRAGC
jgi:hypothetical protein